ncbi:hypothetical protein [Frankia tisae]|nr:hypothetical protein [Frankia tisae]
MARSLAILAGYGCTAQPGEGALGEEGGNVPDDLTDARVSIYGGIARKR